MTGRAIVGIAVAHLAHHRGRSLLAICGIALAVVAMTLLAGTGLGVMAAGEAQFEEAGVDLWVTGGPATFTTTGTGGFENTLEDAHEVADDIGTKPGVDNAGAMGFQGVLVSDSDGEYHNLVGAGIPGRIGMVDITEGEHLRTGNHYADGTYQGPMTHEVVLDERAAELLDVGVGDTVSVGGSIAIAAEHEFTVVGISPTIGDFLGAPTVVLNLDELQTITGTAHRDPAALMGLTLEPEADPVDVRDDLAEAYPDLRVHTNEEQLEAMLAQQSLVIGAGAALVVLAFVAGLGLAANLLALLVYQQRAELAALKAFGSRTRSLAGLVLAQAIMLGVAGGLLGIGLTPLLAIVLNRVGEATVGLEGVVLVEGWVLAAGLGAAIALGVAASVVAVWRVSRLPVGGTESPH